MADRDPPELGDVLAALRQLEAHLRAREGRMAEEIATAVSAATRAAAELDAARARAAGAAELERRQRELEQDLALAEKVHQSLIPASWQGEELTVAVRYRPMRGVGGDLCVLLPGAHGQTFVGVADVTGHGVAAALLATRVVAHLQRLAERADGPTDLLRGCNDFLHAHFGDTGLYLTAMVAGLDPARGRLRLAGAGHPHALLYRASSGHVARLGSQHPVLGVVPVLDAGAAELDLAFRRGDRLLLYTDGITEARNRSGRFLGTTALERLLRTAAREPIEAVADAVCATTADFRRGAPEDDVLVVVAEQA
jgi:sigma-B regulation protein RsbU (phosphoserine phosphatase)